MFGHFLLKLFFDRLQALGADSLSLIVNDIVRVVAENAARLIFGKYDLIVIRKDLKRILFIYAHSFSYLDRQNDSAEMVYHSYNSG